MRTLAALILIGITMAPFGTATHGPYTNPNVCVGKNDYEVHSTPGSDEYHWTCTSASWTGGPTCAQWHHYVWYYDDGSVNQTTEEWLHGACT